MERIWLRPKNKLSKKHLDFWDRYVWAGNKYGVRTLYDCYKNPSGAKESAWVSLTNSARDWGAKNLTVCGYSCHRFSVGYVVFRARMKEPREHLFVYETAENIYHITLEEVSGDGYKPTDSDDVRNLYPKLMVIA